MTTKLILGNIITLDDIKPNVEALVVKEGMYKELADYNRYMNELDRKLKEYEIEE